MINIRAKPLKYVTVYRALHDGIVSGKYRSGDKLPTEHDLVGHFRTSRATVIRALKALEGDNLIRRRQGSGSYVIGQPTPVGQAMGVLNQVQPAGYSGSIQEQMQGGLSSLAQAAGCPLFVHSIHPGADPAAAVRSLTDRGIRGAFLVPLELPQQRASDNEKIADAFRAAGIPVVVLGDDIVPSPRRSGLDVVTSANRYGGFLQTSHLLDLGCRRIAFLGVSVHAPTVTIRRQGYLDALRSRGVDVQPKWLIDVADHEAITEHFVKDLMARQAPDAIVCKSDAFAAMLMRQLIRLGFRVPQDVKLVGFDDRPIATLLPVALTTIQQPVAQLVEQAMHLLQSRIRDPQRPASVTEIDVELIVRESTAG